MVGMTLRGRATVTRPAPDFRAPKRREDRGAALALRPADDQDAAEIALVDIRGTRRDQRPDVLARQEFDPRSLERLDDAAGNADVSDDDFAGLALGRRQDQRQLGRAERHRHRRLDAVAHQVARVGGQT